MLFCDPRNSFEIPSYYYVLLLLRVQPSEGSIDCCCMMRNYGKGETTISIVFRERSALSAAGLVIAQYYVIRILEFGTQDQHSNTVWSGEAKFIMDSISKKLIKDGIHSTIRVNFSRIGEFLATTLPSSAADEVSGAADDEQCCC